MREERRKTLNYLKISLFTLTLYINVTPTLYFFIQKCDINKGDRDIKRGHFTLRTSILHVLVI